jgi:hypothetical protein
MVVSDKDMEGYARDCVRLAQLARNPELREQLMQMARDWMAAAMHDSPQSLNEDQYALPVAEKGALSCLGTISI